MRTREALDALARRLPYGEESDLSRHVAVAAYGQCARHLDRETRAEAVDRLVDLTRDPRDRVRRAAGSALSGLADTRALPALESLKRITAAQDVPTIERWIRKIRKGQPGDEAKALREQLEKLEERYRKLDERVQDLEARPD
jgi:HEAT repeat protein